MGITAAKVTNKVWDAAAGVWNADVTWETDPGIPVSTELNYGEVISGSCSMAAMPAVGSDCDGTHTYPLTGLKASFVYRFEAVSKDAGMFLTSDDGSSPFENTMDAAPVAAVAASVSAAVSSASVSVGSGVNITAAVKDSAGANMAGATVEFSAAGLLAGILGRFFPWLAPVGTVSPATALTDAAGNASAVFTAKRIGIAVVTIKCGSIENRLSITCRR